jgi:hypothetical protein
MQALNAFVLKIKEHCDYFDTKKEGHFCPSKVVTQR